jgi:hypothetical protein
MGQSEMLLVTCGATLWEFGGHVKNPLGITKNPNKSNTTHPPQKKTNWTPSIHAMLCI